MANSQISRLRNRITIEKNTPTATNAANEPIDNWVQIFAGRGEVKNVSAREYFSASQQQYEATHAVTIRASDAVDQQCRIKHGQKIYYVQGVIDPTGRNRYMNLLCIEDSSP